jgi:DNA polymerase
VSKPQRARSGGPSARTALRVVYDIETRSALNLRHVPADVYAAHSSTGLLCLAWQFNGEDTIHHWAPSESDHAELDRLHQAIRAGAEMHSWTGFDPIVWHALSPDWPAIPLEQQHDIAARAAMCGLPHGLEACAAALGLAMTKDKEGQNALRYLMKPRRWTDAEPVFADDPARLALVRTYNVQDIRLTVQLERLLPVLPDEELEIWRHDQRLNQRGFRIDPAFLPIAGPFYIKAQQEGDARMRELTEGAVGSIASVKALGTWLRTQGVKLHGAATNEADEDEDETENDSGDSDAGGAKGALTKATVRELLEGAGLPKAAREALEVRQDYGRSSVAKIVALAGAVSPDQRLRNTLLYHGSLTGRQSGRLFQPQNLPRDSYLPEQWDGVLTDMRRLDPTGFRKKYSTPEDPQAGSPMAALVRLLRGAIVPADGHELAIGDFSRIELVVLAWLAQQTDLLAAMAAGEKIYDAMAARIYGVNAADCVTGERYNFGKMVTLGCGYGLGWRALIKQAWNGYGLRIDEALARTAIATYRGTWPEIPRLWYALEAAAFDALGAPGVAIPVCDGRAAFKVSRDRQWLGLWLPSGRWIRLHQPKLIEDDRNGQFEPRVTLSVMGLNLAHQWVRQTLWGGVLTNYLVQGAARDLLVAAALRCEARGWPVVLQVHDEVVCEVRAGSVSEPQLAEVMNRLPDWAAGCPIASKTFIRNRYGKE